MENVKEKSLGIIQPSSTSMVLGGLTFFRLTCACLPGAVGISTERFPGDLVGLTDSNPVGSATELEPCLRFRDTLWNVG